MQFLLLLRSSLEHLHSFATGSPHATTPENRSSKIVCAVTHAGTKVSLDHHGLSSVHRSIRIRCIGTDINLFGNTSNPLESDEIDT